MNNYKKKIIHFTKSNKKPTIGIQYIQKKNVYPILVPRNDTENINQLLKYINEPKSILVDLGSGSGNMLLNIRNKKYTLIDFNYLAILSTKKLTTLNFCYEIKYFLSTNKKYNIIASNPPYLCTKHIFFYMLIKKTNSLYANFKGLSYFFSIIKHSYNILKKNGILLVEHSFNQSKIIRKLMSDSGFSSITTMKDLNNLHRITYAEK